MEKITVSIGKSSYPITIASGLLTNLITFLPLEQKSTVMIVTNQTLAPIFLKEITQHLNKQGIKVNNVILPDGEKYKTWESINYIFNELLNNLHGRDTILIALGGGVIGDLTGFAAAIYQRGIKYIQIPTTFLAQVDAAIGGKTGVNHELGKNMIGAFHQPIAVIIDTDFLLSLSSRQFASGIAEVIKYAVIFDEQFFYWLEQNIDALISLNPQALEYCIRRCCELKANVISSDEKEIRGIRVLLNFGHTFGHAIEAYMGYGNWLHGEAIAVGMIMAARTAEHLKIFQSQHTNRIIALLQRAKLPVNGPIEMKATDYLPYMQRDKKVFSKKMHLVLPTKIGSAILHKSVSDKILVAAINECRIFTELKNNIQI
ncbi:3-dehydroquinate synthase [Candidatus Ishikawella capsulata]|uniref:3-dehydroquinate synthase n=1 Tax=Candidatus Ishikawaella capsulata Mpkobe TaxID=476281 RepID=C5WDR2_9ENTR|nr:3-dehydroquinate synthase [Candidatus Ishikawaella capsulata]BAH83468.1 3-dehydroquinate synthase [Candidatus Ishikawaella capsulata Mpkobe]